MKKLELIAEKSNLHAAHLAEQSSVRQTKSSISSSIVDSSIETISSLSERASEVRGFASMVCSEGGKIVERWEDECSGLVEILRNLANTYPCILPP